jgi:hypothetical protein
MATLERIHHKLATVFNQPQAQVLSEVIWESKNDLVKSSDFSELKGVVKELADAQKNTEKELRNLARQVGGLSEAFGGSLEDLAIDLIPEVLENHWGLVVEDAERDEFIVNGTPIEVDLVIRGTIAGKPVIVLGEVKSNLTLKEAEKFYKIVQNIRNAHLEELENSDIRVIYFGYRANREAKDFIKENNCFMISTRGKIL